MIEHEHKHYSKRNIDKNEHIPEGEEILEIFKDRKKTPWKPLVASNAKKGSSRKRKIEVLTANYDL